MFVPPGTPRNYGLLTTRETVHTDVSPLGYSIRIERISNPRNAPRNVFVLKSKYITTTIGVPTHGVDFDGEWVAGKFYVVRGLDSPACVFDLAKGEMCYQLDEPITCIAASQNSGRNRLLAYGTEEGVVKLWDVANRCEEVALELPTADRIGKLAVNRNCSRVAATFADDYALAVWDGENISCQPSTVIDLRELNTSDTSNILAVFFHPQLPGGLFFMNAKGCICFLDLWTQTVTNSYDGLGGFSYDENSIVKTCPFPNGLTIDVNKKYSVRPHGRFRHLFDDEVGLTRFTLAPESCSLNFVERTRPTIANTLLHPLYVAETGTLSCVEGDHQREHFQEDVGQWEVEQEEQEVVWKCRFSEDLNTLLEFLALTASHDVRVTLRGELSQTLTCYRSNFDL